MQSETKRCCMCECKESYKINLILTIVSSLLVWGLCVASFILFATSAFVFAPFIDAFPMITMLIFTCITFRNIQLNPQSFLVWRIYWCCYTLYMFIFSLVVVITSSNYYDECFNDTHCDDWDCCKNDGPCYDCSWVDKGEAQRVIIASVFSLAASLLLVFIQIQLYQISRKIRLEQPTPYLIQHTPQQIQVSYQQQQNFQYQGVQQAGIQPQFIQQGLIISQPTGYQQGYQQGTQYQVPYQVQPNPQVQQTGVQNPNYAQQTQQTGAQWPQQQ